MKCLWTLVLALTLAIDAQAQNEAPQTPVGPMATTTLTPVAPLVWKSKLSFNNSESDRYAACGTNIVVYTFTLLPSPSGGQLKISTGATDTFANVGAYGAVDHTFMSSKTANNLHVRGNAQSKQFKVFLNGDKCVWDARPSP